MSMNMDDRSWDSISFGKAALKKIGEVPENFRLYAASWVGEFPNCHGM